MYTRIRSGMSSSAGGDFPLKPLPEEAACLALVSDAEKWLAKVKKAMQVDQFCRVIICSFRYYVLIISE